jgi:hypothetical protein
MIGGSKEGAVYWASLLRPTLIENNFQLQMKLKILCGETL